MVFDLGPRPRWASLTSRRNEFAIFGFQPFKILFSFLLLPRALQLLGLCGRVGRLAFNTSSCVPMPSCEVNAFSTPSAGYPHNSWPVFYLFLFSPPATPRSFRRPWAGLSFSSCPSRPSLPLPACPRHVGLVLANTGWPMTAGAMPCPYCWTRTRFWGY